MNAGATAAPRPALLAVVEGRDEASASAVGGALRGTHLSALQRHMDVQRLRWSAGTVAPYGERRPRAPEPIARWLETAPGERGPSGTVIAVEERIAPEVIPILEAWRARAPDTSPVPFFVLELRALAATRASPSTSAMDEGQVRLAADRLLGSTGPVLIEGATGTGKTRLARRLHETVFGRAGRPFHEVNCAKLSNNPSELAAYFRGVRAGYYTGVGERRPLFEAFDGGTLFLDEFQELEKPSQAMLLDLLSPFSTYVQGQRIGEEESTWSADVQVVVAINEPLRELLGRKLRPDLYHRLWRRTRLLPLREILTQAAAPGAAEHFLRLRLLRMQEAGLRLAQGEPGPAELVERFRKAFTLRFADDGPALCGGRADSARAAMPIPAQVRSHAWPGNFRELESLAHLLMSDGVVGAFGDEAQVVRRLEELTGPIAPSPSPTSGDEREHAAPAEFLAAAHKRAVQQAPTVEAAATALGVDPRALKRRLEEFAGRRARNRRSFMSRLSTAEQEQLAEVARVALERLWSKRTA